MIFSFLKNRRLYSHSLELLVLLSLAFPNIVLAAGTTAGSTISNTATVSYNIGTIAMPHITSIAATFQVDELIQPIVTWQDASPVPVNSPGSDNALSFLLTNSGNGQETFGLARINGPAPVPAGNYFPLDGTSGSIFLENGLQPGFQATGPNADTVYVTGVNDPSLVPDAGQIIYIVSDTPLVANNIQGEVKLTATSLTPGASAAGLGTGLVGLGQGGSSAVVGTPNAESAAIGSYITSALTVAIVKSVNSVVDPLGGMAVMPGSAMTYRIDVALAGTGTATNLVITDPLPPETNYVPGSIIVDGILKTDAADADNANFSVNTVSVSLGDVAAPANIVITFRATIN